MAQKDYWNGVWDVALVVGLVVLVIIAPPIGACSWMIWIYVYSVGKTKTQEAIDRKNQPPGSGY